MKTSSPLLESLWHNELAAVKVYSKAIHRCPDANLRQQLETIHLDHERRAKILARLTGDDVIPKIDESSVWVGVVVPHSVSGAILKCRSPTSLWAGEMKTVSLYEQALETEELRSGLKWVIREDLMPPAWNTWLSLRGAAA